MEGLEALEQRRVGGRQRGRRRELGASRCTLARAQLSKLVTNETTGRSPVERNQTSATFHSRISWFLLPFYRALC